VRDGAGVMWEIPLVEAFIAEIDTQAGRVVLRTIEGLERL
jgi:ribosomal 30S subunit maturation factor RimM